MENIVLVGFGGHARSVADCIEREGKYKIVGYTDFEPSSPDNGYTYLGTDDVLPDIYASGTRNAVVTLGQIGTDSVRHKLYNMLKEIGFDLPVIIDPSAIVAGNVEIEAGTFVGKGAIINSNTHVGLMNIINTGVILEHDNKIGNFCHVAVGTVCGGMVTIGDNSFIGAGSTIIQNVNIGEGVIIGAGATVLHDVADKEKRYGVV